MAYDDNDKLPRPRHLLGREERLEIRRLWAALARAYPDVEWTQIARDDGSECILFDAPVDFYRTYCWSLEQLGGLWVFRDVDEPDEILSAAYTLAECAARTWRIVEQEITTKGGQEPPVSRLASPRKAPLHDLH